MKNFIQIHSFGQRILLRISRIESVIEDDKGTNIYIDHDDGPWTVNESFDEIMDLIKEAQDDQPEHDPSADHVAVLGFASGGDD